MHSNPGPSPQRVARLRTQSLPALWLRWRRFAERIKLTVPLEGQRVHPDVPRDAPKAAAAIHGRVQVVQEAEERIGVASGDGPRFCEPRAPPHPCAAPWSGAATTVVSGLARSPAVSEARAAVSEARADWIHGCAMTPRRGAVGMAAMGAVRAVDTYGSIPTLEAENAALRDAPAVGSKAGPQLPREDTGVGGDRVSSDPSTMPLSTAFDMPARPDGAGRRDRRVEAEPVIARLRSSAGSAGRSLTVAVVVECSGQHRGRLVLRLGRGGDIIASLSLKSLQVEILAAVVGKHTVKLVPEPEEQPRSTAPEELPVIYLAFENSADLDRFRHMHASC